METLIFAGIAAAFVLFYILNRKPVRTNQLLQSSKHNATIQKDVTLNQDAIIRFSVYPHPDEIGEVSIGDPVRFWRVPEYPNSIYIYREGLPLYGMGRLGLVPDSHFKAICPIVANEGTFIAKVYEKDDRSCAIEVRKKTEEELAQELKENLEGIEYFRQKRHTALTKRYNPRKPIEIILDVKYGVKLSQNEKFYMKFEDIETYLNQATLTIEVTNQEGKKVGYLSDYEKTFRILKAHFNGYNFEIENLSRGDDPIRLLVKPIEKPIR
jgi:hypothetical protein